MKISVITTVRNGARTVRDALESVARQKFDGAGGVSLEHIVVDGGSTDGTLEIVRAFEQGLRASTPEGFSFRWVSEPDRGLYDGLNKGIRLATGDVVGICNADDVLANDEVIQRLAEAFQRDPALDLTYADICFVKPVSGVDALRAAKVTRYCTGRFFRKWMFRFATFPAHPSTFIRRAWFEKAGWYSLDYGMFADFEFMLRLFWKHDIRAAYLPLCTHVMRSGGASTGSFRKNLLINASDLRALKANGCWSCLPFVYLKYPFKILGIVFRRWYVRT